MSDQGRVASRCRCVEVEPGMIDETACRADRHRDFTPRLRAEQGRTATVECTICGAFQTHRVCRACFDALPADAGRTATPCTSTVQEGRRIEACGLDTGHSGDHCNCAQPTYWWPQTPPARETS